MDCACHFLEFREILKDGSMAELGGFVFKLQPNCSATKIHAALILAVASLTNKM